MHLFSAFVCCAVVAVDCVRRWCYLCMYELQLADEPSERTGRNEEVEKMYIISYNSASLSAFFLSSTFRSRHYILKKKKLYTLHIHIKLIFFPLLRFSFGLGDFLSFRLLCMRRQKSWIYDSDTSWWPVAALTAVRLHNRRSMSRKPTTRSGKIKTPIFTFDRDFSIR